MEIGSIAEVWRYPVKSMGGEPLASAAIGPGGIVDDRGWAIRETESGKIASAKQPRVYRRLLDFSATVDPDATDVVSITGPERLSIRNTDPDHGEVLSTALGRTVTLERAGDTDVVGEYTSEWPDIEGLVVSNMTVDLPVAMGATKSAYVDLAALHLVSTASLAALGALIPDSDVDHRRFRPNLIVDTGNAVGFLETDWVGRHVEIGEDVVISVSDNTTRCVMTTLAQNGLDQDRAVLQTLATHNQQDFGGLGRSACLGVYAEVVTGGVIRTGDSVRLAG